MQKRPLLVLAALAAASEPDLGRATIDRLKAGVRDKYEGDPIGTTLSTVLIASYLFYRAEHGTNPKVKSFYDALVYVSTNLSVGFSDIFALTPAGKSIGSALMTFGPAMAAGLLDDKKKDDDTQKQIIARLDELIATLKERQVPA